MEAVSVTEKGRVENAYHCGISSVMLTFILFAIVRSLTVACVFSLRDFCHLGFLFVRSGERHCVSHRYPFLAMPLFIITCSSALSHARIPWERKYASDKCMWVIAHAFA